MQYVYSDVKLNEYDPLEYVAIGLCKLAINITLTWKIFTLETAVLNVIDARVVIYV